MVTMLQFCQKITLVTCTSSKYNYLVTKLSGTCIYLVLIVCQPLFSSLGEDHLTHMIVLLQVLNLMILLQCLGEMSSVR